MSPRTAAVSVVTLATSLLLGLVILAMLSADFDRSMIQEPPEASNGEMSESSAAQSCGETTPPTWIAARPPEAAPILRC